MSKNDRNPFEHIGPGVSPSDSPKGPQSTKEHLEGGVKKMRDFYLRNDVRKVIRTGERLLKIGKDVNTGNPLSWMHAAFKVAETVYDFDKVSVPLALRQFKALKVHAHELTQDSVTHLFITLLEPTKIKEVEASTSPDGKKKGPTLYSYPLKVRGESAPVEVFWFQDGFDYSELICSNQKDLKEVRHALAGLLWAGKGRQIEMQWSSSREFAFRRKEAPLWHYEGSFGLTLIARWQKALEIGMRRFVILHGDPGMGKSTLARQLGMVSLDKRVLYVPTSVILQAQSIKYFMDTLTLISPDIVIIDDIDRMSGKLGKLLSLFEETETQVPLLLATTNDLKQLPDALKRPGRFDEIWHIKPPPAHVMGRVVEYLASLEEVSLSTTQVGLITDLAQERKLSGAHIREIVRRIKLDDLATDWGKDALNFDARDLTFSDTWRPRDYKPGGVATFADRDPTAEEVEGDAWDAWDDEDDRDNDPLPDTQEC